MALVYVLDVFKCINVLLGADGYGLANRFCLLVREQPAVHACSEPGNSS